MDYNPAIMELDEGRLSYGNAAGFGDVEIEVEDTLPIARYQPLGRPAEPETTDVRIKASPYTGENAEEGDRVLTVEAEADAWQWYVLTAQDEAAPSADGAPVSSGNDPWQAVEGATGADFVVSEEMLQEYDFRCVFTASGIARCTDSLKGVVYEKTAEEKLPEMPRDIEPDAKKSFSALELDPENPYAGYVFAVTFADGEWVKEIRVRAPEDDEAEAMKFGTLTLIDHLGADILDEAATLTLSVEDNEEPEPFTIDFPQTRVRADRADGSARIHVSRSGGTQTMVTVDYATADGSAVAGRDYQTVKGTAAFYAGVDEAVIEVPLIDDRTESDEPLTFTLTLSGVKGDGSGLCTLTQKAVTIEETNSGNGGPENLATMLTDAKAEDVSGSVSITEDIIAPVEERVITGEAVDIPEEELLIGRIAGLDDTGAGEGEEELSLDTYNYGEITFGGSHSGSYWGDDAYVAGSGSIDIRGWSGGSANGTGHEIKSKSPASASLAIPDMSRMYSGFNGRFEFSAKLAGSWSLFWYGLEYVYGWAAVTKNGGQNHATASSNPKDRSSGTDYKISYSSSGSIDTSWDMNSDVTGLKLGLSRYDAHDADEEVYSRITRGTLHRRSLSNNLRLRIHTANDGESGNGNVVTAPEGAARLTEASGVYASMKPEVTVVPGAGGVTGGGRLYVGSRLRVSLQNLDSFRAKSPVNADYAVYLTRSDGSVVEGARIEQGKNTWFITLLWAGMTDADLKDTYTVNVVMTREQKLLFDLTPSVPRKVGSDGNASAEYDPSHVQDAWATFLVSGERTITVGCNESLNREPYFSTGIRRGSCTLKNLKVENNNPVVDLGTFENVQYINFNRSPGDRILFNGRIYKGNEDIWLSTGDLSLGRLKFTYYNENFLDRDSIMTASILRTGLYLDGDGDGRISGGYNGNTGYFELTAGTEDRFVMMLEENAGYNEVDFEPEPLSGGKYGEYFLKIYYTMIPRSLNRPLEGDDSRAQVLPAFTTSITDQTVYSALTEEQQSYRYILPGMGADGVRTSDNHPMYGAEASAVQFVDVPAGGDHSPVESEGDEEHGYTYHWTPDYHGNLLFPFSNPESITVEHSLAGDNFPLADIRYDKTNGIQTDSRGKENLNGYLGSLVANTTVTLCVTKQEYTADELKTNFRTADQADDPIQPESAELIKRSATPDPAYLSRMDSRGFGDTSTDPSESGNEYAELLPDFGANLPMDTFSLAGYATVLTNKEEVLLTISVPGISISSTNGGKAAVNRFPQTVKGPVGSQFNQLKGWMSSIKDEGKLPEALKNNGYKDGAKVGSLSSTQISGTVSATLIFNWKYDTVSNTFAFREFAIGATGAVAFKYTYRFSPCPIVYVYAAINFSIQLTTGGRVARYEKQRDIPYVKEDQPQTLKKNAELGFYTKYQNLSLQFNGKLLVEVLDKKGGKPVAGIDPGFVKSDGGKKGNLKLSQTEGMEFSETRYVHIVALEESVIHYLNVVESVTTELVWSGVKITPRLIIELGLGAGVDLLKVEGCFKVLATANIVFGGYDEKTRERSVVECTSARFALSLTLRAVLLGATFVIDALGVGINYTADGGWKSTYTLLGKESGLDEASGDPGPLRDTTGTQRIYSPEQREEIESAANEETLSGSPDVSEPTGPHEVRSWAEQDAYEPDDPAVPFQLSGYNSSVSAIKLADGLALGYDYQIVTVNGENYVVFTYGRENPAGELDRPMLVLSRLVSTGGMDSVGLVNPTDDIHPTGDSRRTEIPYIPVDTDASGQDDGTGDLEFSVRAEGNLIRVAWVSLDKPGVRPDSSGLLKEMSRHTVVKTASFDTTKKDGFTAAQVISGAPGNRVLLPSAPDEEVTAWVKAAPMTESERRAASESLAQALAAAGYDPHSGDAAIADIGKYRLKTQEALWDGSGKRSTLCVHTTGGTSELPLPEGQTIDSLELVLSGGRYYAAYTTRELRFTDAAGGELTAAAQAKNILTIRRLFLGEFTVKNGAVVWANDGRNALLRTLYDYEDNTTLRDGIYSGGAISPYEEPYFANLQFLNATLGDALGDGERGEAPEDFLLFEMNGCTYLIRQSSLLRIVEEQTGEILPFFARDEEQNGKLTEETASATGRTAVTIGADGEGGLAAVYVATVPNTTNNALFLSCYDTKTGGWSKGVILAMNHMDVYEDFAAEGWEPEEAEQAYLGERKDYPKGGMDQFTFAAPRIALGTKGVRISGESITSSAGDQGTQTTLLILTQGSMSYLKRVSIQDSSYLTIDDGGSGKYPTGTGIYAISYGVGHQTIGEANLSFVNYDFSAGASLHAKLSFKNTGDMSIRGSDDRDQAITVTLHVAGGDLPDTILKSWTVTENIAPGRRVELEGGFTLPATLPVGAGFHIGVSEGSYYAAQGGTPYTATLSDVLTVEDKPELGFEDSALSLAGLAGGSIQLNDAGYAVLDTELFVGNRGNTDAGDVYIQFTYDTGRRDAEDNPIYMALDLSDHTLVVDGEEKLVTLDTAEAPGFTLKDGVIRLGSLKKGYGRRIKGTITIDPDSCFVGDSSTLGLRVEIFSGADGEVSRLADTGVHHAEHGEYNTDNNVLRENIQAVVSFLTAKQIFLGKGSVLRLPVSYLSAAGSRLPKLQVLEYPDKEDTDGAAQTRFNHMDQNLDRLYYENRSYQAGRGEGTVVLRASKEGSGYIRIMDQNTNSYQDIPFTVSGEVGGLDISPDNERLTFYNVNGSVWKNGSITGQDWIYSRLLEHWGDDFSYRVDDTRPYQGTLMRAKKGTSFTFETEAESVSLYVDGLIDVASDFPDFKTQSVMSKGGDPQENPAAFVYFGSKPEHRRHKVTVTIKRGGSHNAEYQYLDRLVEHYSDDQTGETIISPDIAPKIYWTTSFPKKGSMSSSSYRAQLVVIGTAEIADVSVRGANVDTDRVSISEIKGARIRDSYLKVLFPVQGNGTFTIDVADCKGNHCVQTVEADWWPEHAGNRNAAPDLDEEVPAFLEEVPAAQEKWLSTELVEGEQSFLRIAVDESAPYEDVILMGGAFEDVIRILESDQEFDFEMAEATHLKMGKRGRSYRIPVEKNGLHMVLAYSYPPEALGDEPDEEYTYVVTQPDGSESEVNAGLEVPHNLDFLYVDSIEESHGEPDGAVVQALPDNRLTFDSVSDGDVLYLLKGGIYTYEEGLAVIPAVKKAVTQTARTRRLNVKKDSVLTLERGDETKTVNLRAMSVKTKTVTLNSRRRILTMAELFTGLEGMLPDIKEGKLCVSIKKDNKHILDDSLFIPSEGWGYRTLSDIIATSTGGSGSATVSATFGGRVFTATVRCGGYPVLYDGSLALTQMLPEMDEKGNRVLTFDSVTDGGTLLLQKNGFYALEEGVSLEPDGVQYKNAIKVSAPDKKTGIRRLTLKKEARIRLTKTVDGKAETKTILVNYVNVKKKTVALAEGDSITLADLFTEAYELLPDPADQEIYGGYTIRMKDDKGVLAIDQETFPDTSRDGCLMLRDFTLRHSGRKGTATVSVTFGGRSFKATVKCR